MHKKHPGKSWSGWSSRALFVSLLGVVFSACGDIPTDLPTEVPVDDRLLTGALAPFAGSLCGSVPEAGSYNLAYTLEIPANADYGAALPPYSVDNTGSIPNGSFDRVAYCLQLDTDWIWVSVDAFTAVTAQVGVPVTTTGAVFQQIVTNMNVYSNVPSIVTGTGITTGNMEFWHECYGTAGTLGLGGNDNLYDFDDFYVTNACYGSMQLHNHGTGPNLPQTLFGYNAWDHRLRDDLGIGNSPSGHPDWTFRHNSGAYAVQTMHILVGSANQPPVPNAGGSYGGNEGSAIPLSSATATDSDGDPLTLSWTVNAPATCMFSDASALNPELTCADNGTFTVTLTADDGAAPAESSDATVTVDNVAPTVGAVTVPLDPINIDEQPVTGVSAPYTDPGTADTHTCTVDYDDGSGPQAGTATAGTCTGPSHTYAAAGVYTVTVEVTDDDSDTGSSTAETMIVIYDPTGGFVTGGGWFDSPAGAYKADELLTGKANFGFVSKYKKGTSVPTGNTEFQFKAGDLNFHSSSYEWLVVNQNGENAQFTGEGTINGSGVYKFMIWAGDKNPDTFRIRITDVGGGVIYDNQQPGPDDQPINGGSIKIHTR